MRIYTRTSLRERFNSKWTPEPFSGCWLWTAGLSGSGYGVIIEGGQRVNVSAHRVSWQLHRGAIPTGLFVLHKCDVKTCVNPDHLFIGTQADNVDDMHAKDRHKITRGEDIFKSKLTDDIVRLIRASPESHRVLAKRFRVQYDAIRRARARITWKHVT